MSSPGATVQCDVCCEDHQLEAAILVTEDKLCRTCFDETVMPMFNRALKYDIDLPPKWGTATLRIEEFKGHFNDEFVRLWRSRQEAVESSATEGSGATEGVDPFYEMVRGKEYRKCPGCDMAVVLGDGCNTIICARNSCQQHFCFICGEKAHHDSDH